MTFCKKAKLAAIIIVAISIAICSYFIFINKVNTETVDWNLEDILAQYDSVPENSVICIGSSQFYYGLNASQTEEQLKLKLNSSVPVYNFAFNGDTFFTKLVDLPKIIDAKPKMVIISSSFFQYGYYGQNCEYQLQYIGKNWNLLDNFSKSLFSTEYFSEEQLDIITKNKNNYFNKYLGFFEERYRLKELLTDLVFAKEKKSGIKYKSLDLGNQPDDSEIKTILQKSIDSQTDYNQQFIDKQRSFDKFNYNLEEENEYYYIRINYPESDTVQVEALKHIIEELKQNDIRIFVIHMPMRSNFSEIIPQKTREKYFSILNNSGIEYFDFESRYPPLMMRDLTHLNSKGKSEFSNDMASFLFEKIQEGG
ncbi:hypothetical protein F1737_08485 [Methanoplanus sp. FWC-SCC4]|uniref:DUF1574 domain-containing protein n=1 Tax=Methanochimaera problematica TaxID=2609417 RepID=A0AA97I3H6_9EURY|nr:hypothetical protein [Methanoplanus sp. FWC-SCC4]WOF16723.1 hypothetical protein F1737_08485 [Methanoplanus sp. FWC-SCC4]